MNTRVFGLGIAVGVSTIASATNLNFTGTCDDAFAAYISTNDSVQGTQFVTDDNWWPSVETGSTALTPNVTNYLHVMGWDIYGASSAMIASLSLSDAGFQFDNGGQTLDTDTVYWGLSTTGWGINDLIPTDYGPNGTGPWGSISGVSASARFLWSATYGVPGVYHHFSVRITPVPEVASWMVLGLFAVGLRRRRR